MAKGEKGKLIRRWGVLVWGCLLMSYSNSHLFIQACDVLSFVILNINSLIYGQLENKFWVNHFFFLRIMQEQLCWNILVIHRESWFYLQLQWDSSINSFLGKWALLERITIWTWRCLTMSPTAWGKWFLISLLWAVPNSFAFMSKGWIFTLTKHFIWCFLLVPG